MDKYLKLQAVSQLKTKQKPRRGMTQEEKENLPRIPLYNQLDNYPIDFISNSSYIQKKLIKNRNSTIDFIVDSTQRFEKYSGQEKNKNFADVAVNNTRLVGKRETLKIQPQLIVKQKTLPKEVSDQSPNKNHHSSTKFVSSQNIFSHNEIVNSSQRSSSEISNKNKNDSESKASKFKYFKKFSISFEINHKIPKISFTMNQFPDEVNPKEFFTQKIGSFREFIDFLKKNHNLSQRFKMYFFNVKHEFFYNPCKIIVKNQHIQERIYYVDFSVSYFLISCSELVQLCFMHHLMQHLYKLKKQHKKFIKFEDFLEVLEILNGEKKDKKTLTVTLKSQARKSIFHRIKMSKIGDELEEAESDDNPICKKRSSSTENLPQPILSNRTSIAYNPFERLKKKLSKSADLDMYLHADSINEEDEDDEGSSEDSTENSSSDESSLNEEEYSSKNPFELKFSHFMFRLQKYTVCFENAYVENLNGDKRDITQEEIHSLLMFNKNIN